MSESTNPHAVRVSITIDTASIRDYVNAMDQEAIDRLNDGTNNEIHPELLELQDLTELGNILVIIADTMLQNKTAITAHLGATYHDPARD